jgi:hypothetical protein
MWIPVNVPRSDVKAAKRFASALGVLHNRTVAEKSGKMKPNKRTILLNHTPLGKRNLRGDTEPTKHLFDKILIIGHEIRI